MFFPPKEDSMPTLETYFDGELISSTDVDCISQGELDAVILERDELLSEVERLTGLLAQIYGIVSPEFGGTDPEEFNPDFIIEPGQDITAIIQQANDLPGKSSTNKSKVLLKAGDHIPFSLAGIQHVHIRFEDGAVVEGMKPLENPTWIQDGNLYEIDYEGNPELVTWQGGHDGDAFNNRLMHPLLVAIDDSPLIYNPDGLDVLEEGQFYLNGGANVDGTLYVKLSPDQFIEDFTFSPYWRLMWGDENTLGITIDNGRFHGCSNTGKTGAVSLPGTEWIINDLEVDLVNTVGIELGQGGDLSNMRSQVTNSIFTDLVSRRAGQQGIWGSALECMFFECGHTGSNWKGFDVWWEASIKFENTHYCFFRGFFAHDCQGPGLWLDGVFVEDGDPDTLDGGNIFNIFEDVDIQRCHRVGIEIELGSSNNIFTNCKIDGILHKVFNPEKPWGVRDGYTIKAFSNDNSITGGSVNNVENVLRLGNEDTRGTSDRNVMSGITMTNFIEDYFIEGPILANQLS